jgi:hypothetical protein
MFALILTLFVIAVALLVLFWTGTLLAQGYFYDSPVEALYWRAPAAAGAMAAFLALWAWIEYRWPNSTGAIFTYTSEESHKVDQFWSVRQNLTGEEERILFKHNPATDEYRDANNHRWARSMSGMMVAIVIEEKDKEGNSSEKRFDAEISDGKFAPRKSSAGDLPLRYKEENGSRFIDETNPGQIIRYRGGRLFATIVLNVLHFVIWFLVLWLILHFQWPHALGFAAVCWLVMTLAVVPYLHNTARTAGIKPRTIAVRTEPLQARCYFLERSHVTIQSST